MPFLLRVELPDVPGSLGRVASAIGVAGGDIEAIEIVEKRHDGTAVDDVLLEMHGSSMPDSIVSACPSRLVARSRRRVLPATCARSTPSPRRTTTPVSPLWTPSP